MYRLACTKVYAEQPVAFTHFQKTSGDFPTVLYEVVSKRSSVIESSLSIDELNGLLDTLAQNMGKQ